MLLRADDANSWAHASQVFPYVEDDRAYVLSVWVRSAPGSKHPGRLYYQWRGAKGKIKQVRHNFRRADQWTRCQWRLTPPPGAASLSVSLGIAKRDAGQIRIDDVSLTRAP